MTGQFRTMSVFCKTTRPASRAANNSSADFRSNRGHLPQRRIVRIRIVWPRRNRRGRNYVALLEVCHFINIIDGAAGSVYGVGESRHEIDSLLLRGANVRGIGLDVQSGLTFVPAEHYRECGCTLEGIGILREFQPFHWVV